MKKLWSMLLLVVLVSELVFGGCAQPAPTPAPKPAPAHISRTSTGVTTIRGYPDHTYRGYECAEDGHSMGIKHLDR